MTGLLEREDELQRIERALAAAAAGNGCVVVAAEPAGMGKTKLLEAAVEACGSIGMRPLVARASELEREFAFGVVRQLLEDAVLAADEDDRSELFSGAARHAAAVLDADTEETAPRELHETLHGLYWLLANLGSASPLLVAVDDLQWADEPSIRWLAYLARRLDGLSVALFATARTSPRDGSAELPESTSADLREAVEDVLDSPLAVHLEPAPLSVAGVGDALAVRYGRQVEDGFARACQEHSGGNPFLLSELSAELATQGIVPVAANAAELDRVVPRRVGESTRRHLSRLSPAARELARSVAVLGGDADLGIAAELAGMELAAARAAVAEIVATEVFADAAEPRFRHPLLRSAVEADIPAVELADHHERAARLLVDRGAPSGRVAAHLTASRPGGGQEWIVEQLRAAARAARSQGVPEQAGALLRRALAEPPTPELLPTVLSELGGAELDALDERAVDHLTEAHRETNDPAARAELALSLGLTHYYAGSHDEAIPALEAAIAETEENPELREIGLRLEAMLGLAGRHGLSTEPRNRGRIRRLADELEGATPAEQLVRNIAENESPGPTANDLYLATKRSDNEIEQRLLGGPPGLGNAVMYLHAGRPDAASVFVERAFGAARERGSPVDYATAVVCRGIVSLDVGDLREAQADLETARDALIGLDLGGVAHGWVIFYVSVLTERGRPDDAEALLADGDLLGELPEVMFHNPLLFFRGVLHLAQRRPAEAKVDFRELGRRHEGWGMTRPTPPWRSGCALALTAAGEPERAVELAREELEMTRAWDTPKAIAYSLRALALAEGSEAGIDGLAEAVDLLEGTPWRLDRARARLDLGSALRRAGQRREGREALTIAMDEAHACGADGLVERAAEELRASGARPRRRAISGLDALTPSERRVAALAAEGRTNREIAQELFVTMATVETHLTRVYRKLDLEGRDGLSEALGVGRA